MRDTHTSRRRSKSGSRDPSLELARQAIEKQGRGESLTFREADALKRYQRIRDERDRDRLCRVVPKAFFLRLANSDAATLSRLATCHEMPAQGDSIDVGAFVSRVISLLVREGHKIGARAEDRTAKKLRRERARIAELRRKRLEETLLPRSEVQVTYRAIAEIFRAAQESMAGISQEAADVLGEAIEDHLRLTAPGRITGHDDGVPEDPRDADGNGGLGGVHS